MYIRFAYILLIYTSIYNYIYIIYNKIYKYREMYFYMYIYIYTHTHLSKLLIHCFKVNIYFKNTFNPKCI